MQKFSFVFLLAALVFISGCVTSTPGTNDQKNPLPVTIADGQVLIKEGPPHMLAAGQPADFVFDLNLPEGNEYVVFIYAADYQGNGTWMYSPVSLLAHNATDISGSDFIPVMSPVEYDENGNLISSYANGTVTEWRVDVGLIKPDGGNTTDFATGTFVYSVTWE